jgi:hypothetical protein
MESAWSDSNRRSRAPEARGIPGFPTRRTKSTQPESNRHNLHGEQIGFRYIMGAVCETKLSKIEEHRAGIEPALPRYECGVVAARPPVLAVSVGPDGLEPSPTWIRTRYAAANTLIPSLSRSPSFGTEGIEPSARTL